MTTFAVWLGLDPLLELSVGPDTASLVRRLGVNDAPLTVLHALAPLA